MATAKLTTKSGLRRFTQQVFDTAESVESLGDWLAEDDLDAFSELNDALEALRRFAEQVLADYGPVD
jgi:hypothetical protein